MARSKVIAPTEEYLQELATTSESEFGSQDQQIIDAREVRELKKKVTLHKDLRLVDAEVRDPAVADHGFRVAATMHLKFPIIALDPIRQSDKAQVNATLRERFITSALQQVGRSPFGMHTYAAVVDGAVNDGAGISKLVFDRDCWDYRYSLKASQFMDDAGYDEDNPEHNSKHELSSAKQKFDRATEEAKQQVGPPLKWRSVDVLSWYPVFQGDDLAECLEITERPVSSTFRRWRIGANKSGDILLPEELGQAIPEKDAYQLLGGSVKFVEHWDDTWVTYMVYGKNMTQSGRVIKQWKHGYGRHPYFPAYGLMMNHWRNRKVGWGVNETMRALVELRSFLWTLMANIAARDAFPLMQEIPVDASAQITGQTGRPAGQIERWNLREILRNRNNARLEVIEMPQIAEALKIHMAQVDAAIAKLETPRITGDIGGLEGAGFAISQVLNEMMIRHQPISQNIERQVEEMVNFTEMLIRTKIKEKVWVNAVPGTRGGWIGVSPDDLSSPVQVKVNLDPQQPSGEMVKQRIVHEAISAGTMSMDQGITELNRNADEVRRGRRMDQIRQSPLYQQLADQALLAELGRGDLEALVLQAQAMVQDGSVPGKVPPQQTQGQGVDNDPVQQVTQNENGGLQVGGPVPATPGMGQMNANAMKQAGSMVETS